MIPLNQYFFIYFHFSLLFIPIALDVALPSTLITTQSNSRFDLCDQVTVGVGNGAGSSSRGLRAGALGPIFFKSTYCRSHLFVLAMSSFVFLIDVIFRFEKYWALFDISESADDDEADMRIATHDCSPL